MHTDKWNARRLILGWDLTGDFAHGPDRGIPTFPPGFPNQIVLGDRLGISHHSPYGESRNFPD